MSNEKKSIMPDIIRIKLNSKKIEREVVNSEHPLKFYAGRALSSKIIADEVPPLSDPIGPENKLIFACGFLTGTTAPN